MQEDPHVETLESVRERLAGTQARLLAELNLTTEAELQRHARAGLIPETDTALAWYAACAAYEDWLQDLSASAGLETFYVRPHGSTRK